MADKEQSNGDSAKTMAGAGQSGGDTIDGGFSTTKPYGILPRYNMNFPRVGICLIINNMDFHWRTKLKPLCGSYYDASDVKNTFSSLGYDVRIAENLTGRQMKEELKNVSQEEHGNNASFVCVILSHGEKDSVYGTDGPVQLKALTRYLKGNQCRSLLGKPKLFFINACRGAMPDEGADVVDSGMEPITFRIPLEADFLYAYSTTDGYKSWMHACGSCFIKVLCEMIKTLGGLELMQIMTRVNGIMAYDYEVMTTENVPQGQVGFFRQMPSVTSMLTKEFYFPNKRRF